MQDRAGRTESLGRRCIQCVLVTAIAIMPVSSALAQSTEAAIESEWARSHLTEAWKGHKADAPRIAWPCAGQFELYTPFWGGAWEYDTLDETAQSVLSERGKAKTGRNDCRCNLVYQDVKVVLEPMAEWQRLVMQIKPNRTILQGVVMRIERAADGWGANVEFVVEESKPAEGFPDFLQAKPGSLVTAFTVDPDAIQAGKSYTLTASVLGGPRGERVVIQKVDPPAK